MRRIYSTILFGLFFNGLILSGCTAIKDLKSINIEPANTDILLDDYSLEKLSFALEGILKNRKLKRKYFASFSGNGGR